MATVNLTKNGEVIAVAEIGGTNRSTRNRCFVSIKINEPSIERATFLYGQLRTSREASKTALYGVNGGNLVSAGLCIPDIVCPSSIELTTLPTVA